MRFWTIQPIAVVAELDRSGSVRVDQDHQRYRGKRPWQYDWLAAALARHHSAFSGGWPWWLSCEEPDLAAQATRTLPGGGSQASIELEIPEGRYVTFPLWMWETIFTGMYLAAGPDELEDWLEVVDRISDDGEALPPSLRDRLEASWDRILDPGWQPRFWYRDRPPPDDDSALARLMREASTTNAGLVEELRAGDVVRVTEFQSR